MLRTLSVNNWRAFRSSSVTLQPGLNVLLGRNGAGKSSLLEAIAFSLTGKLAMLSDVKDMARDAKPVDVTLTLELDGTRWEISRGLSQTHRRGRDVLRRANATVAEETAPVDAALEQLLGVPSEFLLRILYMPEGDVYRFLDKPPLVALETHLRRLFGLEQLALIDRAAVQAKKTANDDRGKVISLAEQVARNAGVLAESSGRWSGNLPAQRQALESDRDRLATALGAASQLRSAAEGALDRMNRSIADFEAIERDRAAILAQGDPAPELRDLRARCAELEVVGKKLDGTLAELTAEQKVQAEQRRMLEARSAAELAAGDPPYAARLQELETALGEVERELATLAVERSAVTQRGQALRARPAADLVADDAALRARRDEREASNRQIDDELAASANERKALAESSRFLDAHAPGAGVDPVCPVCRQPLPEPLRQRLLQENANRDSALAERASALHAQRERQTAEARAEAEGLKRRLLAENAEAAAALTRHEARLGNERTVQAEALRTETVTARQRLIAQHDANDRGLTDRLRMLRAERQNTRDTLEAAERRQGQVHERQKRLTRLDERRRTQFSAGATPHTLRDQLAHLTAQAVAAREGEAVVRQESDDVHEQLSRLKMVIQLAEQEGHSQARLAAVARRELLAELFATATAETLRRLRDEAMSAAYGEVERAWKEFSGWSDARVEPQPKGRLVVRHDGRSLDLGQLSGGERAAFLVLLHAHLGRRLGRGSFLLLDEPLEHLDAENGRRLLQHLVRACSEGLLEQIVIATVEADVVRSTIRGGNVNLIELPLPRA